MDVINNINNNFKKIRTKILAYKDNIINTTQKDLLKDIENLFKIVTLERKPIFTIKDIVLLVLSIAVSIRNFIVKELI